jgi:hypothetical protein
MSLRRTPKYKNRHACKQLSFYGTVGMYKNRRISAWHNTLGSSTGGDPSKYTEKYKTVVYDSGNQDYNDQLYSKSQG